jgi:hypothetical protein
MPLAMCMPSSVAPEDLIKVDLVGPEKSGESYYVHYNPQHEWYWASDMKPEEALVFTTWDSIGSAQGTSCRFCKCKASQQD